MSSHPGPSIAPSPAEQFFGLSLRPFSLTPDLRFAFQSRSHSQATAEVTEALRRREGLIVVTGAIGTGKTMLCRTMLETFETRTFLSVILDPRLGAADLMRQVLTDFGIMDRVDPANGGQSSPSRHQMVVALQQFLSSLVPLQAHAVIMIDEAQHLGPEVLEEIRLLSNFETAEAKLLQIVLVGQPDLEDVLRRPDMRQLNQRVARHCRLYPLSPPEVVEYVERRLTVASTSSAETAGDEQKPVRFSAAALRAVADLSEGIPRLVNTVCDRALDAAYERRIRLVDPDAVITAAERLHMDLPAQMVRSGPVTETPVPPPPQPVPLRPDVEPARVEAPPPRIDLSSVRIDSPPPVFHRDEPTIEVPRDSSRRLVPVVAAAVVVVLAGGWWWTHRTDSGGAAAGVGAPSTPATGRSPSDTSGRTVPAVQPSTTPAAPVGDRPASGSAGAATGANNPSQASFTIAVASFRTEQRAREVATAIESLQVPAAVKQDSTGSWYAVVAGPFASRESADAAQALLSRNGYADTRLSATSPDTRPLPQ